MVKKKRPTVVQTQVSGNFVASMEASDPIECLNRQTEAPAPATVEGLANLLLLTEEPLTNVIASTSDSSGLPSMTMARSSASESIDIVSGAGILTSMIEEKREGVPIFKDPNFVHSNKSGQAANKKTRVWKNLKQIIAAERILPWGPNDVTYAMIDAPTSFKPAKKYSDITGLPAKYTDPQTKIRYATSEEFSRIRMMPADLVTGYLALRKANAPVP